MWYFKTFRIFDSPDKDVPDETAVEGTFDSLAAKVFVKAHNEVVAKIEERIEELETYLIEFGDHKSGCLAIATNNKRDCRCGFEQAKKG